MIFCSRSRKVGDKSKCACHLMLLELPFVISEV